MKKVVAERVIHNGERRISLRFGYDETLIGIVKKIEGARWSSQMKLWHVPESSNIKSTLLDTFRGQAFVDYSSLVKGEEDKHDSKQKDVVSGGEAKQRVNKEAKQSALSEKAVKDIEKYRNWMEANRYPESTVRTYAGMISTFLKFVSPKQAEECTSEDLVRIVEEYILPNGLSHSFQNQMVSAVKKFYGKIYKSVIDPGEITRPRPQHRLPNVLSKEQVKRILDSVKNEKHRVMLSLVYGCGLRRSEVLELLPSDVDRDRKLMKIRQAKGFKDRLVPLSDRLIQMLDQYIKHFKPVKYLFEGQNAGSKYSPASLEKVFRNAYEKAGIQKKDITLHGLRHSYATHLLEAGTDLRYIQALLGHKSSRTTEIYTHVTIQSIEKIRSPFDDL
ncbi:MAG: tyrosine-type recombinase/integrase [Bacteroidales bacterium]|nr:tyrosine-type recombinase/integrase [Bacteroidales bacterium]